MNKAAILILPVLMAFSFVGAAAQKTRFPFPTPTPTPSPSPSASPSPTPARAAPCPRISVQAQSAKTVRDGQPVTFGANIQGGDPKISPIINWNVSAGYIKDGQGTRRIEVDSTGAGTTADREIKADIWVGGYPSECGTSQASASIKVIGPAVKFGEFGDLPAKALSENLDALASFLSQSTDNVYLIGYAGRNSPRGFTFTSIRQMKDELVTKGVSPRRIIAIDGGFREEPLFDFWIVPPGAEPPRPKPTVNRNEIVYPKTPPAKKP